MRVLWASLVSLLVCGIVGCNKLQVTVLDCESISGDSVCRIDTLSTIKPIRLHLEIPKDASVLVMQGGRSLKVDVLSTTSGQLFSLTPRTATSPLQILAKRGRWIASAKVQLGPTSRPPWLKVVEELWQDDQGAKARAAVEAQLRSKVPLTPEEYAYALGILGRIMAEQGELEEARDTLRRAIDTDSKARLHSREVYDTLELASLLRKDLGDVKGAKDLLAAKEALIATIPDQVPWLALQKAAFLKERGDYHGALLLLGEGQQIAERLGNTEAYASLRMSSARALLSMGRYKDAKEALSGILLLETAPCRIANALEMSAMLSLLAIEAGHGATLAPEDPLAQLNRALHVRKTSCKQVTNIVSTLTNLARAHLLLSPDPKGVGVALIEAQKLWEKPDLPTQFEWLELEAEALAREQKWSEAANKFQELLSASQSKDAAQLSGDFADTTWRAHAGLVRVYGKLGELQKAEAHAEAAQAYVEKRSFEIPLDDGRIGYLARHERATSNHLQILLAQGKYHEALVLVRRVQGRALRDLARVEKIHKLSDDARRGWDMAMKDYKMARARLNELEAKLPRIEKAKLPKDEEDALRAEQNRLEEAQAGRFHRLMGLLGEVPSDHNPRDAEPGEVLLACHPLTPPLPFSKPFLPEGRWLCLAEDKNQHAAIELSRPPSIEVSAEINRAFGTLLSKAKRLTVYSYGQTMDRWALSEIPDPARGGKWGDHLQVVYTTDMGLPASRSAAPKTTNESAIALLDPAGDFLDSELPELPPTIKKLPRKTLRVPEIINHLREADLFVYFGHGIAGDHTLTRSLRVDQEGGLRVEDILAMDRVPRVVVLLACDAGRNIEARGGAGLSVAQAFLLRGAEKVIAANLQVHKKIGKLFGEALVRQGLPTLVEQPEKAFQGAQQEVQTKAGTEQIRAQRDELRLSALGFRVFVR